MLVLWFLRFFFFVVAVVVRFYNPICNKYE